MYAYHSTSQMFFLSLRILITPFCDILHYFIYYATIFIPLESSAVNKIYSSLTEPCYKFTSMGITEVFKEKLKTLYGRLLLFDIP